MEAGKKIINWCTCLQSYFEINIKQKFHLNTKAAVNLDIV